MPVHCAPSMRSENMIESTASEDRVQFWDDKWASNATSWHKPQVNEFLERHIAKLTSGREKLRIFVPLCGKSVDKRWLYNQGHVVVGAEAVEKPILEFFAEQQLPYDVKKEEGYTVFKVLALLVLCAVAVYARPQVKNANQASAKDPVPIVKFRNDVGAERGSYDFEFQTADDIERFEKGEQIPTIDEEGERGASKSGEFRFITPEGKKVHVTFTAGVEGYRPVVKITE